LTEKTARFGASETETGEIAFKVEADARRSLSAVRPVREEEPGGGGRSPGGRRTCDPTHHKTDTSESLERLLLEALLKKTRKVDAFKENKKSKGLNITQFEDADGWGGTLS